MSETQTASRDEFGRIVYDGRLIAWPHNTAAHITGWLGSEENPEREPAYRAALALIESEAAE